MQYGDIHLDQYPDNKVHGDNMGPIWGRQDTGGPHAGPMNFATWVEATVMPDGSKQQTEPMLIRDILHALQNLCNLNGCYMSLGIRINNSIFKTLLGFPRAPLINGLSL